MKPDDCFVLTAAIRPRAMPRPRGKAGQKAYMPKSYQQWREQAGWLVKQAWLRIARGQTLRGPLRVDMRLCRDRVTVWLSAAGEERHGLTGDVDNYAKALLDVMKDVGVYEDDSQVVDLRAHFHHSSE